MAKITGIGGIIFKAKNPDQMKKWYAEHLGIEVDAHGVWSHYWREKERPEKIGRTVWEVFEPEADNFKPSASAFMVNYRVENLTEALDELREAGVTVLDEVVEFEAGKLGWCLDPEGNKVELWEPQNEEIDPV